MPCKPGVAGSISGFSRRTISVEPSGVPVILINTQIINPPGPVLVSTHGKTTKSLCFFCLSDETLSRCPVFWDALKPEPLPVEPSGVPGQRTTKSINPPGQYWYSQGTRPQTIQCSHRGVGDKPMSCKPGVAGSIPGFSQSVGWDFKPLPRLLRRFKIRTTAGWAFGSSWT